jgi:hypothetical protein
LLGIAIEEEWIQSLEGAESIARLDSPAVHPLQGLEMREPGLGSEESRIRHAV